MQKCPLHPDTEPRLLFNLWYCPLCKSDPVDSVIVKEVAFEDLSAPEKRVAIARDVIARVEAQKIRPYPGYFIAPASKYKEAAGANYFEECEACAVGALLLACAPRLKISSSFLTTATNTDWGRRIIHKTLEPYFSSSQLDEIEAAFEGKSGYAVNYTGRVYDASMLFGSSTSPRERLVSIMNNIIANNGEFNPRKCNY